MDYEVLPGEIAECFDEYMTNFVKGEEYGKRFKQYHSGRQINSRSVKERNRKRETLRSIYNGFKPVFQKNAG